MEEMQANYALNGKLRYSRYLFNKWINKDANTLILPNLSSDNITHKILQTIGPHEAIGPIHILQRDSTVREIIKQPLLLLMPKPAATKSISFLLIIECRNSSDFGILFFDRHFLLLLQKKDKQNQL